MSLLLNQNSETVRVIFGYSKTPQRNIIISRWYRFSTLISVVHVKALNSDLCDVIVGIRSCILIYYSDIFCSQISINNEIKSYPSTLTTVSEFYIFLCHRRLSLVHEAQIQHHIRLEPFDIACYELFVVWMVLVIFCHYYLSDMHTAYVISYNDETYQKPLSSHLPIWQITYNIWLTKIVYGIAKK